MKDDNIAEDLDIKIDRIDNNILKLVESLDAIIAHGEQIDDLQAKTNMITHRVNDHHNRINILEDHHTTTARRIRVLQAMSVALILIASAGAIINFIL